MTDRGAVVLAVAAFTGAAVHRPVPLVLAVAGVVVALIWRQPWLLCLATAVLASTLGARSLSGMEPARSRPIQAPVALVSDPREAGGATRVDVRFEGQRLEAWARGAAAERMQGRLAGEVVEVQGRVQPPPPDAPWLVARHVVGRVDVAYVGSHRAGSPVSRLANGLRRTLSTGAESLPDDSEALFTGFVIGDDRALSPLVVDDFRGSGLSHLLAVSGQNVAFVLALLAPLLRRLSFAGRLTATTSFLVFFALLTRFEPSVLRATVMAGLAALATALGREASSVRLLGLAVAGLVLVDPLLVHSVGFQLSVAASAGIAVLASPLAHRLLGPAWLRLPLAVTIGAQAGVAPVLVASFGGVPVVSIVANLLAAPAAGPITMWGLTAGLVAGIVPSPLAAVLHLPTRLLVEWVALVARLAVRVPLGEWGAPHLLFLATGAVLCGLRRRLGWVILAVGVLVPALALRSPPAQEEIAVGAELWRAEGQVVLVLDRDARPSDVLEGARRAGVRRLDLVICRSSATAVAEVLEVVRGRFGPEVTVAETPV